MAKRTNDLLSLGDALKEFVGKHKLQKGLDKVQVRDVWNDQMGPAIAKYTTAIKLDRDTLFVQLSSSVLREELSYGKQHIIDNLNKSLGKDLVKKLVLR